MFCSVADIRSLLPGVPTGETEDALITRAIALAESEIVSRVGAYIDYDISPVPPLLNTLASYLSASVYLLISMSAGQENEPPQLSIHYRKLADDIIDKIIKGDPVVDSTGNQVGAGSGTKPIRSYTLSSLGVRS